MTSDLLSTAQAAELLGVRTETIYSYVSRGVLHRADDSSRHDGSMFRRSDVISLRDSRIRKRSGIFEVSIDTAITRIESSGRLFYRGHDAVDLAETGSYPQVAELLWQTGGLRWDRRPESIRVGLLAREAAPEASPAARARLAVAMLAANERAGRWKLPHAGVLAINAAVDAVLRDSDRTISPEPEDGPPAQRLADALSGTSDPRVRAAVESAMILLADHELATSTVAARVAASTGAGVFDVLVAGLSAMPGPRHAQVSADAGELLNRSAERGPREAIAGWPGPLPGFGHVIYTGPDPRATALLNHLALVAPEALEEADELIVEALRATGLHPNIDLALAVAEVGVPLVPGAGEAIFTIARIAGFVAHLMEEQGQPLRFRARAEYVGPDPIG